MTNKSIAKILRKTATLMALVGENKFKVRAYEKGARAIRGCSESIEAALDTGDMPDIQDVGKGIAAAVKEIHDTGELTKLHTLCEEIPVGIVELSEVRGLGAKKLRTLWKDGGYVSADEVIAAAEDNQLVDLKGFGAKTQANVYNALIYHVSNKHKLHISTALSLTEKLHDVLDALDTVHAHSAVGELRRNCPTIEQLEWLVAIEASDEDELIKSLKENDLSPDYSAPVVIELGDGHTLHLHTCAPTDFAVRQFKYTTTGQHLDYFEDILDRPYAAESDIYAAKQLPFVLPELRENTIELDLAKADNLPQLLETPTSKGVLHAHSTYSDGAFSLEEMAEACIERGYQYLGITDHSKSAFYADGLDVKRVEKQWKEIDKLNSQFDSFRIFKGIESDILHDGNLDYPDEVLAGFDFIIASVHSGLRMDANQATERLLKAIKNPYTTLLGHPTGRLLLNRPGYPIDHKRVIDAAAEYGVAIELNSNPWRLDIDWTWLHYMQEQGVKTAICPDAHSIEGIDDIRYGVMVGRKGFLTAEMTLNCLSTDDLQAVFEKNKP